MSVRRRVLLASLLVVALLGVAFAVMLRPARPGPIITRTSTAAMPIYRPSFPVDPRMPVLDSHLPLRRDTSARRRRGAPLRLWRQDD